MAYFYPDLFHEYELPQRLVSHSYKHKVFNVTDPQHRVFKHSNYYTKRRIILKKDIVMFLVIMAVVGAILTTVVMFTN